MYLGVRVLMRGAPWCAPRVRMKQRVRAVGVRSELIRGLPPSQRGILVADAVASLWMAGGTFFWCSSAQTHVIEVGWSIERFGGHAIWQTCSRSGTSFWSRCAQNVPACSKHLHFLFVRMVSTGRWDVFRCANLWTHRAQCLSCVHGLVEACRTITVDWCALCELSAAGATFSFSSAEGHYSVPFEVGEFKHATSGRARWMSNLAIFSAPRCLSFHGTGPSARLRLAHWRNG